MPFNHMRSYRYSVVRDFTGHGLGRVFHTAPTVLHYGEPSSAIALEPGMIFTIEPMINAGRAETKILTDGWTGNTGQKAYQHSLNIQLASPTARQKYLPYHQQVSICRLG